MRTWRSGGKFSSCSLEEFEEEIRPLVRRLATKGTLWGWPWIRVYVSWPSGLRQVPEQIARKDDN
jgi:hypothetical protein